MDMKAARLYTGLGGAFCDFCEFSKEQCQDVDVVVNGFQITRNIEDLRCLFEDLCQDDGSVAKSANDYELRKGLTSEPIPIHEVLSVQVLHALLGCTRQFMHIVVHLRAGVPD